MERREFIKIISVLGLAATLPKILPDNIDIVTDRLCPKNEVYFFDGKATMNPSTHDLWVAHVNSTQVSLTLKYLEDAYKYALQSTL